MAEVTDFARKYRPSRLSEYVGNATIIRSALKFLKLDDASKPQVLLMHGNSGCGKTTFARLICSCYGCESPLESGDACGTCYSCQNFAEYIETGNAEAMLDLKEVDATDDNGRRAIDDLIDDMNTPSLTGGWRMYILDECHLLTQTAQARLLKTIEEPPEKVLICLCTTNPEKMLDTIKSRCHYEFRVQKPKRAELIELLRRVCVAENVNSETRALSLIATKGEMIPRNSLHQLQIVVNECGEVTYDKTAETLNIIADKYYFTFYKLLMKANLITYKYIMFINEIAEQMPLSQFLDGLLAFTLRGVYVYNNIAVDGLDKVELKPYADLFAQFTPGELVFMMDYLTKLRGDPDLELKLLRLGYTGIKDTVGAVETQTEMPSLDQLATTAANDNNAASETLQSQLNLTSEERNELIADRMKPVDTNSMLAMFNGIRVNVGDNKKEG